ncbi:MAG: DUF1801 domain-containing protein [Christensenellaceae bacterium]|jgi:uncharacterized protein YdhG (YjbR/CyaY superfamily)|nr:DUF1801 domain-containing protein [Christensenellaceae bacterium]
MAAWVCPTCGREFKIRDQHHFCEPLTGIGEYIEAQPEEIRPRLYALRETIRQNAPKATERIAWRMPTFWQGENLIHFAAFKKHIGIYPGEEGVRAFAEQIEKAGFKSSKGAIQLPNEKELPLEFVAELTRFRVRAAEGKE